MVPPARRSSFESDLRLVATDIFGGVSTQRGNSAGTAWRIWHGFCIENGFPPDLRGVTDPLAVLLVFQTRWRDGRLAPKGQPVMARSAEDAGRFIGQALSLLGTPDPRYDIHGRVQFQLTRQIKSWKKTDRPSQRRAPVPGRVLLSISDTAHTLASPELLHLVALMWLLFFFVLRPGEILKTSNPDQQPFLLRDVHFRTPMGEFCATSIPLQHLRTARECGLHFTLQKNQIAGEVIWQGKTDNPRQCPVRSTIQLVTHLRTHGASATTPLYTFFRTHGQPRYIADRHITQRLRLHATACGLLELNPTVGGLRATGATAMLQSGRISSFLMKLLGRWRSDEVMRYLHTQASMTRDVPNAMNAGLNF